MYFQQQSRKENHEQVVEEDRRNKAPKSHEAKRIREEWELKEIEERKVGGFPELLLGTKNCDSMIPAYTVENSTICLPCIF